MKEKYKATRFFKRTGVSLTGSGFTQEEARKELRAQVEVYREGMEKGTYLKGVVGIDGQVHSVARPALAQHLSIENAKKRAILEQEKSNFSATFRKGTA